MKQTPYYVFDMDEFSRRATMIKSALAGSKEKIALCFSIKANPFLLHSLPKEIDRVEVCSPGELDICMKLGIKPESIIYSGVMKEKSDIEKAIRYGAGMLTCESIRHASLISQVQTELQSEIGKESVRVILRLTSGNQFGMSLDDIRYIISNPDSFPGIYVMGIHYYSGTQKSIRKIKKDLERVEKALQDLKEICGFQAELVEYGPGLCVEYFEDDWQLREREALEEAVEELKVFAEKYPLGIEMGRFLAASCGKYYTQVMDLKSTGDANYVILDGGIHHLNYYGQRMAMQVPPIELAGGSEDREVKDYTLCGSLCTVADVLVREVSLPELKIGDILEFGHCGAYSVTEAPALFLSRQLPAIYACSDKKGCENLRGQLPAADINLAKTF